MTERKVRVLIVDDSALVRKVLQVGLEKDPNIEVIGMASNPYIARDILVNEQPDVITLDVEMPKMDGVTFLRKFMPVMPTPTIIVSSLTDAGKAITVQALEAGAVDIMTKPKVGLADGLPLMMEDLCERVKAAAKVDVSRFAALKGTRSHIESVDSQTALDQSTDLVIAIGASTGGVEALSRILPVFPAATPGIVIVQHMPEGFTESFAERLNKSCTMNVSEAKHNDRVKTGHVLIAPGGSRHCEIHRCGGQYRVHLYEGEKVSRHRPSVDVLFNSVAKYVGKNAVAILMTGMGRDGADGLKAIRDAHGATFVQDEATSVVFGMPKVAWEMEAAMTQVPLQHIPRELMRAAKEKSIT